MLEGDNLEEQRSEESINNVHLPRGAGSPPADNEIILHFKAAPTPPSLHIKVLKNGDIKVTCSDQTISKETVEDWLANPTAQGAWEDADDRSLIPYVSVQTDGDVTFSYNNGLCHLDKEWHPTENYGPGGDAPFHVGAKIKFDVSDASRTVSDLENAVTSVTTSSNDFEKVRFAETLGNPLPGSDGSTVIYIEGSADDSISTDWTSVINKVYRSKGTAIELMDAKVFLAVNGTNWVPPGRRAPPEHSLPSGGSRTPDQRDHTHKPNDPAGWTKIGTWLEDGGFHYEQSYLLAGPDSLKNPPYYDKKEPFLPWGAPKSQQKDTWFLATTLIFLDSWVHDFQVKHTVNWSITQGDFSLELATKLIAYLRTMKGKS